MNESEVESVEELPQEKPKLEKPSITVSVPMRATIEDILRAVRIVMDKGGNVRYSQISAMFGSTKSDRKLLGRALSAASAFGLFEPHKGKAPYVLSNDGARLLTISEEQQKSMLLSKFLGFAGYKDILIAMRNNEKKSLKKQTITDMWMNITGGKIGTRQYYTQTFASVGKWCGALTDSGQTCILASEAEKLLSEFLKGGEIKPDVAIKPIQPIAEEKALIATEITQCPVCSKPNLLMSDKYLDKVPTKGGTILILERTFQCQGCSNKFTRIIKEMVPSPD